MISFSKKEQIVILLSILLIVFSLSYKLLIKDKIIVEKNVEHGFSGDTIESEPVNSNDVLEDSLIFVHISGQVYSPGIIELVRGDRVVDAVNLAGGLTKDADLDRINLAKKVEDEEKIYVPKKGEEYSIIDDNQVIYTSSNSSSSSGKININKCTIEELESLPGIGSAIGSRIIDYRSSTPFKNIEDIKNVSGIGDKKFEAIKDLITVK